jgi:hypothetical protein
MPKQIPPPPKKNVFSAKLAKVIKKEKTPHQLREEEEAVELVQYRMVSEYQEDTRLLGFLPDEEIKEDEGADALRALRAQA